MNRRSCCFYQVSQRDLNEERGEVLQRNRLFGQKSAPAFFNCTPPALDFPSSKGYFRSVSNRIPPLQVLNVTPSSFAAYTGAALFFIFSIGFQSLAAQGRAYHSNDPFRDAPRYRVDRWRTTDGLPDNTINALLQTTDGYLWIATQGGLVRFDGHAFTVFNVSNTKEITINAISALAEGRDRTVWIGTSGAGILRYRDGIFHRTATNDGLPSNYISALASDQNGGVWIGTVGGGIAHLQGDVVTLLGAREEPSHEFIKALAVDSVGGLWVGTGGAGVEYYHGGGFTRFTRRHGLSSDHVQTLRFDRRGTLWVGTTLGLTMYRNGRFIPQQERKHTGPSFITALHADREGGLWVGTNGEGAELRDGDAITPFTMDYGLTNNFITCIIQDGEGSIWIGTERGGLNRLRKTSLWTLTSRDGLPTDYVRSVYEDRLGTLWIGTNGGGIARLRQGRLTVMGKSQGLPGEFVRPILEDSRGVVWIGTWGEGLLRFDRGVIAAVPAVEGRFIRALLEDRRGAIWVGTNGNGVIRLDRDARTVLKTEHGLSNNFISSIVEDSTGAIWVGTSGGGVNVIRGDSIRVYTRQDGLSHDFVSGLYVDPKGTVWLSTNGGGLNRFQDGVFHSWSSANGFPDDALFMILDDHAGSFWLPCARGIIRVHQESLVWTGGLGASSVRARLFNEMDGMPSGECTSGSQNTVCRTRDGRLWFATVEGLVMMDPGTLRQDTLSLPLYIEQLLVDETAVDMTVPADLDVGDGELEFHYTAIHFRDAGNLRFRYLLEGFDRNWQDVGTRRTAYYTNVPPGRYNFRVTVASPEGDVNAREASLSITLRPPFWMTTWFRVVSGMVLLGLVILTVRLVSTRALQRRLRLLEAQHALERERMRISKDMHDELGASLTRLTLLSELAKRDLGNPEAMRTNLDLLSNSTRDIAATMDEIVWAVNPKNDTLDRMTAYILEHAREFLSVAGLESQFDVPDLLPPVSVSAEVRHNLFMAIKEVLNNIVKHSNASEVRITLRYQPPVLDMTVGDNGKGFSERDVRPFSEGLSNLQKRIDEIRGTIRVETAPGRGTSVRLSVHL